MATRERDRGLRAYFQPRLSDRLHRLVFDHGRPGRASLGDRAADRLAELLVVAGARLLLLTLFVDLVTGDLGAVTAFNAALALPVAVGWLRRRLDAGHGLGTTGLRGRLRRWRRP